MKKEPIELRVPHKIVIFEHEHFIELYKKWFGREIISTTFLVIIWDGFSIFWYLNWSSEHIIIAILFPLAGIGLTYYVIAVYLNKTYIRVDNSRITIKHVPIPFFGNKSLNSSDIKALFCKKKNGHSGYVDCIPVPTYVPSRNYSYEIYATTNANEYIKLLSGIEFDFQALFIIKKMEKFLQIEDKTVNDK